MSKKCIVAATDFSKRSEIALRRAAILSKDWSAELFLLHVVDDDLPQELVEQKLRHSEIILEDDAARIAGDAGRKPKWRVLCGDPWEEIVKFAQERNADLIVMGSHRKRLVRDVFIGTTIERVIRSGHYPVLMVNEENDEAYGRAIAAIDMSNFSSNAMEAAQKLGIFNNLELSVLHTFEPFAKGMMLYANVEREKIERYVDEEAMRTGRDLAAFLRDIDLGDKDYNVRIEEGSAFFTIEKVIGEEKPDLLVIGTRGLTGAKRVLLGSVADAVLRKIKCDILAVPQSANK